MPNDSIFAGREEIGESLLYLAGGDAKAGTGVEQTYRLPCCLVFVWRAGEVERADGFGEFAAFCEHFGEVGVGEAEGEECVERCSGVGFRFGQVAAAEERQCAKRRRVCVRER
jgi:hypothetical protein